MRINQRERIWKLLSDDDGGAGGEAGEGGEGAAKPVDLTAISQADFDAEMARRGQVVVRADDVRLTPRQQEQQVQQQQEQKKPEEPTIDLSYLGDDDDQVITVGEARRLAKDLSDFQKNQMAAIPGQAFSKAEQGLRETTMALDNVKATLDKYPDMPAEDRRDLMQYFGNQPTERLKALMAKDEGFGASGMEALVEQRMFRAMQDGRVKQGETRGAIPPGAPTHGTRGGAAVSGIRARLSDEQREFVERSEAEISASTGKPFKYSDEKLEENYAL